MKRGGSDTYDCKEMIAFWAEHTARTGEFMPAHVRDYIIGQNGGVWPGQARPKPVDADDQAPF